jgi:hypothetical protein
MISNCADQYEVKLAFASEILACNGKYLLYSVKQPEYSLFSVDLASKQIFKIDKIYPSLYYDKAVFYGNSVILYNQLPCELISYDLKLNKINWSVPLIKDEAWRFGNELLPALVEDKLYFLSNIGIITINANTGKIINPEDINKHTTIRSCDGLVEHFDDHLIINTDLNIFAYDFKSKDFLWKISNIKGMEGYFPTQHTHGTINRYGSSYFIQYIRPGCADCNEGYIVEFDTVSCNIINKFKTSLTTGVWNSSKYLYVFPVQNRENILLKFDLEKKTITNLPLKEFYKPLGITNNKLIYTTKDTIVITDFDGHELEKIFVGSIDTNNCRLFDNKIYYINGIVLKVIDVSRNNRQLYSSNVSIIKFSINSNVYIFNYESKTMDCTPIIINGRTMLPARYVVEELGGKVTWEPLSKTVTCKLKSISDSSKDNELILWLNKNQARLNGKDTLVDINSNIKPLIINGRTMIPMRFLCESLECSVEWDNSSKSILVRYGKDD